MPSARKIPTIQDFLRAYHDGVRSFDKTSDRHDGSKYDDMAGIGALVWSKAAQYTRDVFRADYFGTADGDDLTTLIQGRYQIARNLDAFGTGTVVLKRPSAGAGAGTIHVGTRLLVYPTNGLAVPQVYAATAETPVAAAALSVTVPIKAVVIGAGSAIDLVASGLTARVDDNLWDNTLAVVSLVCSDGTGYEKAANYRGRVIQAREDARAGYFKAIRKAALTAGAVSVALFASDVGGASSDFGISACYVGDASYASTPVLIRKVKLALENVRICGAEIAVLPMARAALAINATVNMWSDPGAMNTVALTEAMTTALQQYFGGAGGGFSYRLDAMSGRMTRVTPEVQSVTFTAPLVDMPLLVGTPPQFPQTLTRYTVASSDVTILFAGPQ